jgi:class 3 adenylate cyclase
MSLETAHVRHAPVVGVEAPGRQSLLIAITQPLEIGRDCSGLMLADPAISRRHLLVLPDRESVRVSDLGTTNGSTLGGSPLEANHILRPGEAVCFGRSTIRLVAAGTSSTGDRQDACATNAPPSLESDPRATSIDLVADAVMSELPGPPMEPDVGTVTLVFCDIENSTTRAVELGDAQWIHVIENHNTIVRRMVARHGGTEVKAQGDGFMLRFKSARSAIACMVDVQRALAAHATAQPMEAIRVRTGIHTGEVIVGDDGDIYGRHVIMAARLSTHAQGGEVLVSSLVREIVEPRGDVHFGPSRTVVLKGLGGSHLVHPVSWQG